MENKRGTDWRSRRCLSLRIDHAVVSVAFRVMLTKFKERESNSYKTGARWVKSQDRSGCFWMSSGLKPFRSSQFQCFARFHFEILNPRNVFQDSEVVIEHFSAKYGAGFHVTGNVYISVGHSVHALPYTGQVCRQMPFTYEVLQFPFWVSCWLPGPCSCKTCFF